jgi:hypothetical protein
MDSLITAAVPGRRPSIARVGTNTGATTDIVTLRR